MAILSRGILPSFTKRRTDCLSREDHPAAITLVNTIPIDSGHSFRQPEETAQFQFGIGAQFASESLPRFNRNGCPIWLGAGSCWLTYRNSYLRRPTRVPWAALAAQLGAEYSDRKNFKRKLLSAMRQVLILYPAARVNQVRGGILLKPSPSHIRRRLKL